MLRVTDRGPGYTWSGRAELPDAMSERGRGLFIAHRVARRLRVARLRGNGTVATAWLPIRLHPRFSQAGSGGGVSRFGRVGPQSGASAADPG